MSNHYKHILINDVQHIVAIPAPGTKGYTLDYKPDPIVWHGPAFEGTKTDEEIEPVYTMGDFEGNPFTITEAEYEKWKAFSHVFKAARPKEVADHIGEINGMVNQPVQQEEPEQFYCRNISGGTQPKCDSQCHTCKKAVQYRQNETQLLLASKFIKDIHPSTPIVSEGEQREEGRELQSEINKKAYAELIEQDVEAINKYLPESSLEKDHIKLVLFKSIDWLYSPSSTPLEQKELKSLDKI